MTQPNITPEGFRTAAYLATKARLDAARSRTGKTRKQVTCTPPNVKCGGRCIPPNWDCRLKGQGADPQLRAVQTDPVGGLANIERGAKRIGKGIAKGSFSEIEGGKRAIVRGVVKAVPGDIQRKKELAAKLERQGARVAVGLAVVGAGLGIHNLLMKRNTLGYRDTVGANINNAVRLGVNKVLDATPIIKTERERKRAQAQVGIQAALMRQTNPVSKQLTNQLANTGVSAADEDSRSNLINNLNKVYNNPELSGPQSDFNAWNRAHQRAFWSTTRKETGVGLATGERGSIFARPATDEFLTRQFNLQGDDTLTPAAIKDAISRNLETYKEDLVNLAQQQGFKLQTVAGGKRVISRNDRRQFIKGVVQSSLPKGQANDSVRSAFTKHLEQTLSKNPDTLAGEIYRDTYRGFDNYYKTKATTIRAATAEPFLSQPLRQAGATETLLDANQSRAAFISGKRTAGPIHAELVLRQHHAEVVRKAPGGRFEVSDRVAVQAIQELTGNTVSAREAFRLLDTEHGFSGIRRAGGAVEPRRPGRRAQVQLSDRARQLREAARARGEEMSMEASIRAAKADLARRQRGDALPPGLIRTATYLAVRADLRGEGKPCGASHIPKAHTCTKGPGSVEKKERQLYEKSATKAEKAYVEKHGMPKDTLSLVEAQLALEKESKQNKTTLNKRAALAVAAIGATAITGAYVIQDMKRVAKEPNMFKPTPSTRTVAKEAKKEFDTKKSGTAMGNYYTKKSGLKPGDVVYYRNEKDPAAHFGIYIGEGKDGKVRAVMANTNEKRAGFVDVMELGTTKPNSNDAAHFMFPVLQKAPPLKNAKARTNEETVRRALRAVGTDYKFSLTRDNCEVLANSVAYDTPRSQQLERFKRLTRSVADSTIGVRQRTGMAIRRARGQRVTKALTAQQILQRLSRDDNSFITEEGKALAKAHYSQFFESGTKLDAAAPLPESLVSPETLWKRIKDYDDDKKAVAMRDYLLVTRLALSS